MKTTNSGFFLKFVIFGLIGLLVSQLTNPTVMQAGSGTWNNSGSTSWLTAANWNPNTSYPGTFGSAASGSQTDVATFGSTAISGNACGIGFTGSSIYLSLGSILWNYTTAGGTIGNSSTTVAGTLQLNGASVNVGATGGTINNLLVGIGDTATQNLTIQNANNSGTQTMGVALNNASGAIYVTASRTLTISSAINGSGFGFTKSGAGTLTLSGNNTYTGSTAVSAGTLSLGSIGALGNGTLNTSDVTVSSTAIFDLGGFSPTAVVPLNLNSTASTADVGSIKFSSGSVTYGGTVSLGATTVVVGQTGTLLLFSNTVTGNSKSLKKDGLGTLELSNSGTVLLGALQVNRGGIQVDSGTTLNVSSIDVGTGNNVGGSLTMNGGNVISSGTSRFGQGTGTSPSGTLNLNNGILTVPALTKGTFTFNANFNGGTLKASANSSTFFSSASTAKVQAGGAIIDDGGFAITISQALTHDTALGATLDGGLSKSGTGTLTLSGANNYTGPTAINTGRLQFANETSLYNNVPASWTAANLTVASGATAVFNVGGSGEFTSGDIDLLAALGTASTGFKSGSTLGFDTSSGSFSYATAIANPNGAANTRGLLKLGANTLTLSGPNSFSGPLTLSGGTLQLQNSTALPSVAFTMSSGTTLQLRANSGTTFSPSSFVESGNGTFNFDVNNNGSGTGQTLILANMGQFGAASTSPTFNVTGGNNYKLQLGSGSAGSGALNVWNNTTINSSTAGITLSIPGGININFNSSYALALGGAGNLSLGPLVNNQTSGGQKNLTPTFGGSGTITLNGANKFGAAAGTVSSTGTLALNNNGAFTGLSTLALNSAVTLDNTSGGTVTISATPAQTWSSDFTFGSANTTGALNLGTGTVTLGATRNVTVANSTYGLTVGGIISGATYGLTKSGAGTLTLSGANIFGGGLTVNNGTISFATDGNSAGTGYPLGVYPASVTAAAVTLNGGGLLDTTTTTISANRGITLGASGGTLEVSANQILTVNSVVTGSGGLTKGANNGTVILAPSSGNNNYGGATVVNGGKLVLQSSQTGTGNITVADGASLGVTVSGSSQLSPGTLTLGATTGATLEFNSLTSAALTTAPVNPTLVTANGTTSVKINNASGLVAGNSYKLIANAGSLASFSLAAQPTGISGTLAISGGTLVYQVSSVSDIWNVGTPGGNWDIGTTANWAGNAVNNTPVNSYQDGDGVLFDDTVSGPNTVTVAASVSPAAVVVNNSSTAYTLASSGANLIGGTASITKSGSSTLTLSGGVNTNMGATTINGGTVSVGKLANGGSVSDIGASANSANNLVFNGGTLQYNSTGAGDTCDRLFAISTNGATLDASGSGALNLNNTGSAGLSGSGARTLALTGTSTAANTLAAVISDNGGATALTKSGAGSWTLSGANNYSGATTLSAGTLALSGNGTLGNGSSALTVSGGTLDLGGLTTPTVGAVSLTGTATIQNGSITITGLSDTHTSSTATISAGLLGSAGLTKTGAGTLTLSGANTFTGGVNASGGAINLIGDQSAMTGGYFVGTNNAANTTLNIGSSNQTAVTRVAVGTTSSIQVGGSGGSNFEVLNAVGASGLSTLITNNGILLGARNSQINIGNNVTWVQNSNLTVQAVGGFGATFNVNSGGALNYNGSTAISLVPGGANATGSAFFTVAGGTLTTAQGFNCNVGINSSFSRITLNGGGKLVLSADVASLVAGDSSGQFQLGTGGGVIDTAGFATTIGFGIGDASSQTGSLTKKGNGTLTLAVANSYSGGTTNSAGTLLVNNSTGSGTGTGSVIVTGGTFGGSGTISGAVTVNSGGTLAPGTASIGTLTINNSLALSGNVNFRLNKSGGTLISDQIIGATSVTAGGALNLTPSGDALADGDTFTLFNVQPGGTFSITPTFASGGTNWWTTNNFQTLTYNLWPTAGIATYHHNRGLPQMFSVASLLANNISGATNGKAITLTSLAGQTDLTTAVSLGSGATLQASGPLSSGSTLILYTPASTDNGDTFSYGVSDGRGGTSTGTVSLVTDTANVFGQQSPQMTADGNGNVTIKFYGVPGYSYYVQRATDMNFSQDLTELGPFDATTTNPVISITNSIGVNNQAYYRLEWRP